MMHPTRLLYLSRLLCAALTIFFASSLSAYGQQTGVDLTFNALPLANLEVANTANPRSIVVQPDGKLLVWGAGLTIGGAPTVLRLNSDGSTDGSFSYCACLLETIKNVAALPNGKLLVAGVSGGFGRIVRLNSDGGHDPSFNSTMGIDSPTANDLAILGIQPDGGILANLHQAHDVGFHSGWVVRFKANDGAVDSSFTPIGYDGGRLIISGITSFTVDSATGSFYVGKSVFSSPGNATLRKYNAAGLEDAPWTAPSISISPGDFNGLCVQTDGALILGGQFTTVNGFPRTNFVRLLAAGNVDPTFIPPTSIGWSSGPIKLVPNGKLLVSYSAQLLPALPRLARLNADGSLDATFNFSTLIDQMIPNTGFDVDSEGRPYFFGKSTSGQYRYYRLTTSGEIDSTFNPEISLPGKITAIARQADGKYVIAGYFTKLNGVPRNTIARVNVDGSLDPAFNGGTGFDIPPTRIAIQTDGKILVGGGEFFTFNGTARRGVARLNPDGSLDDSFNPLINNLVRDMSLQSDGMILIAGSISLVNGSTRTGIARLTSTGALDNTFNPIFGAPQLGSVVAQPNGKIMVSGSFSGVNGFNRIGVVRLNSDGSLDESFDAGPTASSGRVWLQADGKYILTSTGILRRNSNGTLDTTFTGPTFQYNSTSANLQALVNRPDGTMIVGGQFSTVGSLARRNLIRLTSTGAVDEQFLPNGPDLQVSAAIDDASGKIMIGGDFVRTDNVLRAGVARLNIATFRVTTAFDFDGDGKADVAVYRPSSGVWYQLFSNGGPYGSPTFGLAGDIPVPADYDGDGKTDLAIFRPSSGQWWYNESSTGQLRAATLGQAGDIPLPSDYTGDGKDDFVAYRPSNGSWYRTSYSTGSSQAVFGIAGDIPVVGDFDGDGKSDPAIFRPSNGDWWYMSSAQSNGQRTFHWGASGDIPAPADFDGDGKTDFAVFRPSNGAWYIFNSSNQSYVIKGFGLAGDRPAPADYDGDGKADMAVFRPSTGVWYILQSTAGITGAQWGLATDVAVPNAFLPQ